MKSINLRKIWLACFVFVSAFAFTVQANESYYYTIKDPRVGNVNSPQSSQQPVPQAKLLEAWYTPPLSGQGAILGFGLCENRSGTSNLPTFWAQKGKATYHYTYGNDGKNVYRQLYLYSSEFPKSFVMFQIKRDYSGSLYIGFLCSNGKIYDAMISGPDAKKVFLWAARKVRDLGFPKRQNDTLFIDVDF